MSRSHRSQVGYAERYNPLRMLSTEISPNPRLDLLAADTASGGSLPGGLVAPQKRTMKDNSTGCVSGDGEALSVQRSIIDNEPPYS